jgi:hypothetical protein
VTRLVVTDRVAVVEEVAVELEAEDVDVVAQAVEEVVPVSLVPPTIKARKSRGKGRRLTRDQVRTTIARLNEERRWHGQDFQLVDQILHLHKSTVNAILWTLIQTLILSSFHRDT